MSVLSADTVKCSSSVMAAEEADILVIGGGPVGLTMAAELSYRGIKNILVENKTNHLSPCQSSSYYC